MARRLYPGALWLRSCYRPRALARSGRLRPLHCLRRGCRATSATPEAVEYGASGKAKGENLFVLGRRSTSKLAILASMLSEGIRMLQVEVCQSAKECEAIGTER